MIDRLTIFGATGDLTARFLLPALGTLCAEGYLPDGFQLTCAGREEQSTDHYQRWALDQLDRHAPALPRPARDALLAMTRYVRADVSNPDDVAAAVPRDRPVAAYLALPPFVFAPAVTALRQAGEDRGQNLLDDSVLSDNDFVQFIHHQVMMAFELVEKIVEIFAVGGQRNSSQQRRMQCRTGREAPTLFHPH